MIIQYILRRIVWQCLWVGLLVVICVVISVLLPLCLPQSVRGHSKITSHGEGWHVVTRGGEGGSLKCYVTLSNFQPKHKQSLCMPLADTPVPVIDMDVHLSSPWGNEWSELTLTLTIRKNTSTDSLMLRINGLSFFGPITRGFPEGLRGVELVWRNFRAGSQRCDTMWQRGRGGCLLYTSPSPRD